MFEKHFVLFTLTKLVLKQCTENPDRYRPVCHTEWQCGGMLSALGTAFPPDGVLYTATSHIVSRILRLFWTGLSAPLRAHM